MLSPSAVRSALIDHLARGDVGFKTRTDTVFRDKPHI